MLIPVSFSLKRVKYEGELKQIIDQVDAAYHSIDPELRTEVESEDIPKRSGFLYATADIIGRVLNAELFAQWRILRDFTVRLDPTCVEVYEKVRKTLFNETLILHKNSSTPHKGLKSAAALIDTIEVKDRFVLLREIFCRLVAISLSDEAQKSPETNGRMMLEILQRVAEDINSSGVTYDHSLFGESVTPFTTMLQKLSEPIRHIGQVIEAAEILNLNNSSIQSALKYLRTARRIIRQQMVGVLSYTAKFDLTTEMLREELLDNTFDIVHRRFANRQARDKSYTFSQEYIELNNLLGEIDILLQLFNQISIASHVGGWTFWLLNVIDINLLIEEISKNYQKILAVGKQVESQELKVSPVGIALNNNNAWSNNVSLQSLNVATMKRLSLLQDPDVVQALMDINHSALTTLVDLHQKTRFKFINAESLMCLPGAEALVENMGTRDDAADRVLDMTEESIVRRIVNQTIKSASLTNFGRDSVRIMSGSDDIGAKVVKDLKFFVSQGFLSRRGNRIRAAELKFVVNRLSGLLAARLFVAAGDNILGVREDQYGVDCIKHCINAVLADLSEHKDTRAAFMSASKAAPSVVVRRFKVDVGDDNVVEFSYDFNPMAPKVGLIDLPDTTMPGTPYEQVKSAIDFEHDAELRQQIIDDIGGEIYNLLKEKPDSSMFSRFRRVYPEIFEKYAAHRQKARDGLADVPAGKFEAWHASLGQELKEIEAFCKQAFVVKDFVAMELEAEGRLTTAFIRAWTQLNHINVTIFQDMGQTSDGQDRKPMVAYEPKDKHSSQQYYILQMSPYSFVTVKPAQPSAHEHDLTLGVQRREAAHIRSISSPSSRQHAEKLPRTNSVPSASPTRTVAKQALKREQRSSSLIVGNMGRGGVEQDDSSNRSSSPTADLFTMFKSPRSGRSSTHSSPQSSPEEKKGAARRPSSARSDRLSSAQRGLDDILKEFHRPTVEPVAEDDPYGSSEAGPSGQTQQYGY